jgi:hypothetical protein
MGGLIVNTPDKIASNDIRNINRAIATTNNRIGQVYFEQSTKLGELTRKFFDDINFSKLDQNL